VGVFKVQFWIARPSGKNFFRLEGYVDTGAVYSVVPADVLERVGIERSRRVTIKGICCSKVVDVGDALFRVEINGETIEGISSVIFGDDPHLVLLGSHALEALGLEVDSMSKKLKKAAYIIMY